MTAEAIVNQTTIYVGESFPFQIQVSGHDQPEQPDLSSMTDFVAQPLGGGNFSSESSSVVNGRVSHVSNRGYTFNYQLTPKRPGQLVIPAIPVKAGEQLAHTRLLRISVTKPVERDDFKLRLALAKTNCYLGEPVVLEVSWYLSSPVLASKFTLPTLSSDAFQISELYADDALQGPFINVQVDNEIFKADEGEGTLNGKQWHTIRFRKVLIPKREGVLSIEPAQVAFEIPSASPVFPSVPFSAPLFRSHSFPSVPGGGGFGSGAKVIIPANGLTLSVKPLPALGRPSNFNRAVGPIEIDASATPTNANVGDPIVLTVKLSGPPGLDHLKLPPLEDQPGMSNRFILSADPDAGERSGRHKVFTQTIRPRRAEVKEIPPIEIPYFDPISGTYRAARSKPISLSVNPTKIVTAADPEGLARGDSSTTPPNDSLEITPKRSRISAMGNLWFGSVLVRSRPFFVIALLLLIAYLTYVETMRFARRRRSSRPAAQVDPAFDRFRDAFQTWCQEGNGDLSVETVQATLQAYLGGRLGLAPAALTFHDIREPLLSKGVQRATIDALEHVFRCCEGARFGHGLDLPILDLVRQCDQITRAIEQALTDIQPRSVLLRLL